VSVELRGGCYALNTAVEHEVILCGPRDTGKTVGGCYTLHCFATVPKAKLMIMRKTRASMPSTVLPTLERVVTGSGVVKYGGSNPSRYIYPNGAAIWVAGMDDPGKALSGEWDAIYVVQAEELAEGDWETLAACCSGRGAVVANPQLFGDCNPGPTNHWILKRAKAGKLKLLRATHKDNPELYTPAGELTPEGAKRLAVLYASYSGARRKRMVEGEWASAEGAVYEFSRHGYMAVDELTKNEYQVGPHVLQRNPREMKRWFLAADEGLTRPMVLLLVGEDSDGRWHVFREFYKTGVLRNVVVALAKAWFLKPYEVLSVALTEVEVQAKLTPPACEFAAVDEAAAGLIADLVDAGVAARPGKGRVMDGVQTIKNRLACAADGRPRLTVDPLCVEMINEFESYEMDPKTDKPKKENDHCFAGETRILTQHGYKRIDQIGSTDAVFSPFGWNKVIKAGSSGVRLVRDYGLFRATPDHKVLTHLGIFELDALRYFHKLLVWQEPRAWSLTELLTGVILTQREQLIGLITNALLPKSLAAARAAFTEQYGNTIKARYLATWRCTILTLTLTIMRLIILSLLLTRDMLKSIIGVFGMALLNICEAFSTSQPNGTVAVLGVSCMSGLVSSPGKRRNGWSRSVKSAPKTTKHPFLSGAAAAGLIVECEDSESGEILSFDPTSRSVTGTLVQTYNIATEYGCYFAEGILVSNSMDAIRYLADALGEPTGAWTEAAVRGASLGGSVPGLPQPRIFTPRHFEPRRP